MADGITKRIVIIKDIHSNLIEEAILILKGNTNAGFEKIEANNACPAKQDGGLLLKEAEFIINNIIKENQLEDFIKKNDQAERSKNRKSKDKGKITNSIINTVLAGSIILLIFIITRLF